jgi:hypothetical protein
MCQNVFYVAKNNVTEIKEITITKQWNDKVQHTDGRISFIENSNDLTGIRTGEFPVRSILPQPTNQTSRNRIIFEN